MKKCEKVEQKKSMHITQSGKKLHHKLSHPGCALDLKAKDLIGPDQPSCLVANQVDPESTK